MHKIKVSVIVVHPTVGKRHELFLVQVEELSHWASTVELDLVSFSRSNATSTNHNKPFLTRLVDPIQRVRKYRVQR